MVCLFGQLSFVAFVRLRFQGGHFRPLMNGPLSQVLPSAARSPYKLLKGIFPELIVGGEWTSTIKLVNRGASEIAATNLFFVDSSGNLATLTLQVSAPDSAGRLVKGAVLTSSAVSFSLLPGNAIEATFVGTTDVKFGHIFVGC